MDDRLRHRAIILLGILLTASVLAGCLGRPFGTSDLPVNVSRASSRDDQFPVLAGNIVVWEGGRAPDSRVYISDVSEDPPVAKRITGVNSFQQRPHTDGSGIVWMDARNQSAEGSGGRWEIRHRNLGTGFEQVLTNGTGEFTFPVIDGQWVAWIEWNPEARTRDIVVYDLEARGISHRLTGDTLRHTNPIIDRSRMIFVADESFRPGEPLDAQRLTVLDLETGNRTVIPWWENVGTRLAPGAYDLDGNLVVWEQLQEDPDPQKRARRFFLHDLASGDRRELTMGGPSRANPSLDGRNIAWADSEGRTFSIYYGDLDGNNFQQLSPSTLLATMPHANSGRVVFVSAGSGGDAEVFLWRG